MVPEKEALPYSWSDIGISRSSSRLINQKSRTLSNRTRLVFGMLGDFIGDGTYA